MRSGLQCAVVKEFRRKRQDVFVRTVIPHEAGEEDHLGIPCAGARIDPLFDERALQSGLRGTLGMDDWSQLARVACEEDVRALRRFAERYERLGDERLPCFVYEYVRVEAIIVDDWQQRAARESTHNDARVCHSCIAGDGVRPIRVLQAVAVHVGLDRVGFAARVVDTDHLPRAETRPCETAAQYVCCEWRGSAHEQARRNRTRDAEHSLHGLNKCDGLPGARWSKKQVQAAFLLNLRKYAVDKVALFRIQIIEKVCWQIRVVR
mmetsp:Transcript_22445/g.72866  ORF Transcript_22445/g.72866 Transcript_22445/m.72866 type:complete len:264 (-) Transcript_22445:1109-1900(-)